MNIATAFLAGLFFGGLVAAVVFFALYLRKDDARMWERSIIVYYVTAFGIAPAASVCAILSVAMMIANDDVLFALLTTLLRSVIG